MNNYYLYHEPLSNLFHWIPYDYDNTFSIDWFGIDWAQIDPYEFATIEEVQGQPAGERPLVERIMQVPEYRDLYTHFLEFYLDAVFRLDNWEDRLEELKDVITPWAEADTFRTLDYGFTIEDFHQSYTATGYSNQHVKRGLREFVNLRAYSLPTQLSWENAAPSVYDVAWMPSLPAPDDTIDVTAALFAYAGIQTASIRFASWDGSTMEYPMAPQPVPGTTRIEDADRWVGSIPPLGPAGEGVFHVAVVSSDGQTSQFPRGSGIQLHVAELDTSGVVLNEFLARNSMSNTDPNGEYDDWLELYNPTSNTVDLAGHYLTDDRDNLTRWQFPEDTSLMAPSTFLVVWCDDDEEQEGLHANFRLDGDGEFLALVSVDGVTILDSITFGEQTDDISFGRHPDGFESWRFLYPSPGTSNLGNPGEIAPQPIVSTLAAVPNPTSGATEVAFTLSKPAPVVIGFFDVVGREIWKREFNQLRSGKHTFSWHGQGRNGGKVPPGAYVCRVRAGQHRSALPIIRIR
jgi:hypothetical protein